MRSLGIKTGAVLTDHDPLDRMPIAQAKSEKHMLNPQAFRQSSFMWRRQTRERMSCTENADIRITRIRGTAS